MKKLYFILLLFGPFIVPPVGYFFYKYLSKKKYFLIISISFCFLFIVFQILEISFTQDWLDLIVSIIFVVSVFVSLFYLLKLKREILRGFLLGLIISLYYGVCIFWIIGSLAGIPDYIYYKEYSSYESGLFEYHVKEKNLSTALNHSRYFSINKSIRFLPFEKFITSANAMELYRDEKPIIIWENKKQFILLKIGFEKNKLREIKL